MVIPVKLDIYKGYVKKPYLIVYKYLCKLYEDTAMLFSELYNIGIDCHLKPVRAGAYAFDHTKTFKTDEIGDTA